MIFSACPYLFCLKTGSCSVQDPAPWIRCGTAELCKLLALEHPSLTPPRLADRCRASNRGVHTSVRADQTFFIWENIEYLFSFLYNKASPLWTRLPSQELLRVAAASQGCCHVPTVHVDLVVTLIANHTWAR